MEMPAYVQEAYVQKAYLQKQWSMSDPGCMIIVENVWLCTAEVFC